MRNCIQKTLLLFLFTTVLTGCRRDDPVQDVLFDTRSSSEIMYDIPLNGGAIEGRWTLNYEEYISYVNEVQVGFDSSSYSNGAITLEFFSNGNVRHVNQNDTVDGTYSVSGNQLSLSLTSALHITSFGIENNRMHCNYSAVVTVAGDSYRDVNEYLFSRY